MHVMPKTQSLLHKCRLLFYYQLHGRYRTQEQRALGLNSGSTSCSSVTWTSRGASLLLYNGNDNVYLERLEIVCTYKMLGTCRHSGRGKAFPGRRSSSKNNRREVEDSLMCTGVSLEGMRNGGNEEERCRKVQIAEGPYCQKRCLNTILCLFGLPKCF